MKSIPSNSFFYLLVFLMPIYLYSQNLNENNQYVNSDQFYNAQFKNNSSGIIGSINDLQLNDFYERQKTPSIQSKVELYKLGDVVWQRYFGEKEYFLAPEITDIPGYIDRITSKNNKLFEINKSTLKLIKVILNDKARSLLMDFSIRIPYYYSSNEINVLLPEIDIETLFFNEIELTILQIFPEYVSLSESGDGNRSVIWSEGFEGVFPGSNYSVGDNTSTNGNDYWDDINCDKYAGSWSIWCAANGDQTDCANYDDYMDAYVYNINGINVSGYSNLVFSFYKKYVTENSWDKLQFYYSANGTTWTLSTEYTGSSNVWNQSSFNLTGTWTNFYWKFNFHSDVSNHSYVGAYLDNMQITGDPGLLNCIADVELIEVNGTSVSFGNSIDVALSSLNETFQIMLRGENDGTDNNPANYNNITFSFPQYTSLTDKNLVATGSSTSSDLTVQEYFGSEAQGGDGYADYVMVEGVDNNGWLTNESNNLYVNVQPKNWGAFVIKFRMGLGKDASYNNFSYDPTGGYCSSCSPSNPDVDCLKFYSYNITANIILANSSPNSPTFITSGPSSIYPTKSYSIQVDYTDNNGAGDLQYVYLRLAQNDNESTQKLTMMWPLSGNVVQWAEETQVLTNMSASKTTITNGYRVTWNFTLQWNWIENTNVDYWAFSLDDANAESTHIKQNQNAFYESDIRINSSAENADPVTAGENYTVTGLVSFEGTSTAPDDWTGISVEMRKTTVGGTLLNTDNSVSSGYSVTWTTQAGDVGTHNVYIVPKNSNHQPPNDSDTYWDLENVTINPDLLETRIKDNDIFIDKTAKYGIPILLEAKLQSYEYFLWWDLNGQTVNFEIYYSGSWHQIPDDGIASTSFITANGIASVYYTAPTSLSEGNYPIRAKYNGNSNYMPCELQKTLNIHKPKWLWLVYLDADNDLESYGVDDFYNEMWQARNNIEVSICVLFDRIPGHSSQQDDWTDTRFFRICESSLIYQYLSSTERNMGSGSSLNDFINQSLSYCSADNKALVIWNHGAGAFPRENEEIINDSITELYQVNPTIIDGVGFDYTDCDFLTNQEIRETIDNFSDFDILGFDACLMQMFEDSYDFKASYNIIVASEETIPGDGWPYDDILTQITNTITVNELATLIVNEYHDKSSLNATLSAVRASQVNNVEIAVDNFAAQLLNQIPANWSNIYAARNATQHFENEDNAYSRYYDLYDFSEEIEIRIPSIAAYCNAVQNAIGLPGGSNLILSEAHQSDYSESHGVSIYFPPTRSDIHTILCNQTYNYFNNYQNIGEFPANLLFCNDNQWNEFLNVFFDLDNPSCTITQPNMGGWFNGNIPCIATASDPTTSILYVEFQYSLNNSTWNPLPGPDSEDGKDWYGDNGWGLTFQTISTPIHGTINDNTVWVRSRASDLAGNLSGWDPCNTSFGVDNGQPTGTIVINGGASTTTSNIVTLTLNSSDNLSGVTHMRFSNNGSSWSDWETFSTTRNWDLFTYGGNTSYGIKTVYAKYKDAAQNESSVYTDQIEYVIASGIVVVLPNGSENWLANSTYTITWTDNITENIKIELFKGGILNLTITASTASDGSHSWTIPSGQTAGNDYKIKITSINGSPTDQSDNNFTISAAPFITVTAPNGGENWQQGSTQNITWSDNISENVKLELYKGGAFNLTISASTTSDGSYSWVISSGQTAGTDYKIKITSINGSPTDQSDNNFTISVAPLITVTFPNGSETWVAGSTYSITWTDNITENVKIELFKGGILNLTITASTASDGSYSWTIPSGQTAGNDYKIKITSINGSPADQSDNNFTIQSPVSVPLTRNLQNIIIPNGQSECYDATQTITVAGSGTTFIVQNGGDATLIAGQNILLMPGTTINSGGYLLAYITTDGIYCAALESAMVSTEIQDEENESIMDMNSPGFKVYPNPTSGLFTLEFDQEAGPQDCFVQIFNMTGARIIAEELKSIQIQKFNLLAQVPGIYIIQVVRGDRVDSEKIIKQ